ncbi:MULTISPECIES: flagellar filament capping protein FliD [unclassified Sphingobium]|uniref:flagellar filament capping protein FliD n=1 Tax=unclassified Sphingobium TaxID=2611147 RepID=UPI001E63145B|nr:MULTISPECIES: flagellar filament capping protein FliD [unclassified Sphingobium]GLI97748.1 flagellar hook-associated protein 2 [Sphingobium sp. BS19]CAH0349883.1 Flagellar hook-associated protein 2 [Sphingobium sp. CECT 9361]
MSSISSSIANSLGIGSGIDSAQIVADLTAAARDPKAKAINNRISLNNARISGLASATSSLTTFSKALTDLLGGTGFSGQPASNDPTIAGVSLLPGGVPTGLPAQIEVQRLASAQTMESAMLASKTSEVGLGTLTLTKGGTNYTIDITAGNNTLEGLAAAVNATGSGVSASVVTDNRGARLVMKGPTGETNGFSITAGTADANLQRFATSGAPGAMVQKTAALDSIIYIDGIEMRNNTNTIDTAIPYVRIDLNKAAPGTKVTLASTEPANTMRDLVTEFVTAYNSLRSALNTATATATDPSQSGALNGDTGIREMQRQLSRLTSTTLTTSGPYRTLGDLGVATNRDGTLKLDMARLDAAIAADPTAVTQMLNPAVATDENPGIAGAVKKVSDTLLSDTGALKSATSKYDALKKSYAAQLEKLDKDMDAYEARTSAAFAAMDTKLAALKATQSYIEQQVKVWTNSNS